MNVRFIRITDQDRVSIHDTVPLLETRDTLLRLELGGDGKVYDCRPVPVAGGHYEPTFTVRARDGMAANLVDIWALMADIGDVDPEKVISAKATATAMRNWKG